MTGIDLNTIFRIEQGLQMPEIHECSRIAQAFGMSFDNLIKELLNGNYKRIKIGNVLTTDLSNTYPYNLVNAVYGKSVPILKVNLQRVFDSIDSLDEPQRMVIQMHYADGLSIKEIAERMTITERDVCRLEFEAFQALHRQNVEDMPISDLHLSKRAYNCLKRAGINVIGELTALSIVDLMMIRNMGERSVSEIQEKLEEYGLSLKMIEVVGKI